MDPDDTPVTAPAEAPPDRPPILLTRELILASTDMPDSEYVTIPSWGGQVLCHAIAVGSRELVGYVNRLDNGRRPTEAEQNVRANVGAVIMGAADAEGNRLFKWTDAEALRNKHWLSVLKVAAKVYELSSRGEVGSIEEGKESSEPTPD